MFNWLKGLFNKDNKLPPEDFFRQIKDKRQTVTRGMLEMIKDSLQAEIQAFLDTGQIDSAERLMFHLNCVEREQKVIDAGFTTYVYRDDLDIFITSVSKNVVKIIDLAHYERKIPENEAVIISNVKDMFDEVYIVFTDYTGKEERKVKKKDQAKDPIAFGAFKSKNNKVWNHRFYFICDWSDEYCDLTLDKYVAEMMATDRLKPVHVASDITIAELEERIAKAKQAPDKEKDSNFISLVTLEERV